MDNKKIVIVDLDGTLALNQHRHHYIYPANGGKPDWDGFFLACVDDSPNESVISVIQALHHTGHRIHIFSARGEISHNHTVEWLKNYRVPYHSLTLRPAGCFTPDEQLKREWLEKYYPNYASEILCIFDDRDRVVEMWRSLGLSCFQVADGNF